MAYMNTKCLVDLTYELNDVTPPAFPDTTGFQLKQIFNGPVPSLGLSWLAMNDLTLNEHVGTHVDSPYHGVQGGRTIDKISLDELHGPAVVIDISDRAHAMQNATVNVGDLEKWETKHGAIPCGAFVIMNSGWGRHWGNTLAYRGLSNEDTENSRLPGFSFKATEWLLRTRDIRGMGSDTISCDPGNAKNFPSHRALFENDKICVLNLANVGQLPASGSELIVMPLKIKGGSGAPARVVALVAE